MVVQEKTVDVNGIKTKYLEAGSGKPLVLIHGIAHWSKVWKFNTEPLSKDYRVIVPDLIGHGDTDKPQDGAYDPEYYSKWLGDFLKAIDAEDGTADGKYDGNLV